MAKEIELEEGVIRQSLVEALESIKVTDRRVSSYYLNLDVKRWRSVDEFRRDLKKTMAEVSKRIDELNDPPVVRHVLHRDWEQVAKLALSAFGERYTRSLACFVSSESGQGWALRFPWPVREHVFLEDRFVTWPLRLLLEQADRYGIILTDTDDARLFLFFLERIEEETTVADELPGHIRYPDRFAEMEARRHHREHYHYHFDRVSELGLRLFEREQFQRVIIGGLWETLPEFESRLHRYLTDRIVARWDIDVKHTPTAEILERAREEERAFLTRQAQETWKTIQDLLPQRGALGPNGVFSPLWQRRVQALLTDPDVARPGFRCTACGRLNLSGSPCVECGGTMAEVPDVYEEAVHDAIGQAAHVRYWNAPALTDVGSIAAIRRF